MAAAAPSTPPELPMFVINLDSRPERLATFREAFSEYPITRFPAIRPASGNGVDGCRESHFAIVRMAKERRYPWVMIMEDDCCPYPYFKEEFAKMLPDLWAAREFWDIYNGGIITPGGHIYRIRNNILNVKWGACSQMIIVNSSAYDKVLNWRPRVDAPAIDMYYNKFHIATSAPLLTYQSNSPSDIQKGYTIGATTEFIKAAQVINGYWIR
jgi:hypothetical protein